MKLNTILAGVSLIIFMSCTSCTHFYYAPNSNNVPLFKEKNEMRASVQYVETSADVDLESASGVEIQTAYAVSNNVGVQLNFMSASLRESEGSGSGTYIEAAGGYFKPIGLQKKFVFETYAGIGLGGIQNHFSSELEYGDVKTSISKFFIQPSFGFTITHFSAAFSSKFSLVTLDVKNSNLNDNSPEYKFVNSLQGGKSYFFWEPGIMLRTGFKHVQFIIQFTKNTSNNENVLISTATVSIGAIFPITIKK